MRRVGFVVAFLLGLYLIVRAVAEVFLIDYGNPDSYRLDWGGPSLAGVMAVHCGPGIISAVLIGWWVRRRLARRTQRAETSTSA
ncbi:MAG TPA: hypothetical protein VH561_10085 [Micromonosporaceae bacterium]|jgi:hypothetical protein